MKDRFKAHFGASFDTFMDGEDDIKDAKVAEASDDDYAEDLASADEEDKSATTNSTLKEEFFSKDKDEMLLHSLKLANS